MNDPDIQALLANAKRMGGKPQDPNVKKSGKTIILYKNGFKVGEDGEFRDLKDPKNQAFLKEVKQGALPMELYNQMKEEFGEEAAKAVGVGLVDKSQEEYQPPADAKFKAFGGNAHSLQNDDQDKHMQMLQSFADAEPRDLIIDEDEPTITIQLILHDGKKVQRKLNASNTVFDLYCLVQHLSNYEGMFDLMAGFPPKTLLDPNLTVKEAGLNGARVTQKILK
jgi:hypothetical protein